MSIWRALDDSFVEDNCPFGDECMSNWLCCTYATWWFLSDCDLKWVLSAFEVSLMLLCSLLGLLGVHSSECMM